jgi:prepilin-type N-terminal cleavage/methylation domain-containing protein
MNKQKGFTIIELIVVIAIIAVLAAIVLVNVTTYINKGKNAAVRGNMATLLTNAAAYFDQNTGKFGSDFIAEAKIGCGTGSPIQLAVGAANGATAPAITCVGDTASQAWCGSTPTLAQTSPTVAASTFCVDSTGYKGVLVSGKCTGTTYTCQ